MDHIPTMAAVMTPFPFYVDVSDSLLRARDLMREHEVRHLPVVKNHELLGILTDRDLKRALTPTSDCRPRTSCSFATCICPTRTLLTTTRRSTTSSSTWRRTISGALS